MYCSQSIDLRLMPSSGSSSFPTSIDHSQQYEVGDFWEVALAAVVAMILKVMKGTMKALLKISRILTMSFAVKCVCIFGNGKLTQQLCH